MKTNLYLRLFLILLALIISYFVFQNKRMSDNWMGPYLSSASNIKMGGEFMINIDEVNYFKSLSPKEQDDYRFVDRENLTHYNHNPIGYTYLIRISKILFPFVGDQMSIILFQCFVFLLISYGFFELTNLSDLQKNFFLIIWGMNPIILKFVVFNFYYFWQVVPSVLIGYLLLSKKNKNFFVFFFLFLLPITILTRPTILISSFFVFYLIYKKMKIKYLIISLVYSLCVILTLYQPTKKNIWHTVYVGIGAYKNSYKIKLSDNSAYKLYENKMNEKINASIGGNYYDEEVINKYTEITKEETCKIFKENPIIFVKNLLINTLIGYSVGYVNGAPDTYNYILAFFGLIMVVVILKFKKYFWFFAIGFSLGTFTSYYPPIPAYMFGIYLLNVLIFITVLPMMNTFIKKVK